MTTSTVDAYLTQSLGSKKDNYIQTKSIFGTDLSEKFIWASGKLFAESDASSRYEISLDSNQQFLWAGDGNDVFYYPSNDITYIFGGNGDDIYVLSSNTSYYNQNFYTFQEDENQGIDTIAVMQSYELPRTRKEIESLKGYSATSLENRIKLFSSETYIENLYYDQDLDSSVGSVQQPERFNERISKVSTDGLLRYSDPSFFEGNSLDNLMEVAPNTGSVVFMGHDGGDTLLGSKDKDILFGQIDNDYLEGKNGDDFLFGGSGDDTLKGGSGADFLMDSPNLSIFKSVAELLGKSLISNTDQKNFDNLSTLDNSNGGNNNFYGGEDNDILVGDEGNDFLSGDEGNDLIIDSDGNNTIMGGIGNDVVVVYSSANSISGGDGDDAIYLGVGNDTLDGGNGNDYVVGGKGAASINGGAGDDSIVGSAGNDVIDGGTDNDAIVGSAGNDVIKGGTGTNLVSYSGMMKEYKLSKNGSVYFLKKPSGENDTLENIQILQFKNDVDTTSIAIDKMLKGESPVLVKQTGGIVLNGADKPDKLEGTARADTLNGLDGDDTLTGGDGNDVLYSYNENYYYIDTYKVKHFTSIDENTNNYLYGGNGNDTLVGASGNDFLEGGDGNDSLNCDSGAGIDRLDGGDGDDVINITNYEFATSTLIGGNGNDSISADGTYNFGNSFLIDAGNGDDSISLLETYESTIVGGDGNDSIKLIEGRNNNIDAGKGNDSLISGDQHGDEINTFSGGDGNDVLKREGKGIVLFEAGNGNDTFFAGTNSDMYGDSVDAIVDGGTGSNTAVFAYNRSDYDLIPIADLLKTQTIAKGILVEIKNGEYTHAICDITGGRFAGICFLKNIQSLKFQDVTVSFNSMLDSRITISTSPSKYNDFLTGTDRSEKISGLAGDDTIIGGLGADTLTGGAGADVFKFPNETDSGVKVTLRDTITDFKHSQKDKIDLSNPDYYFHYNFVGTDSFSKTDATGQLRFDSKTSILYGSTDKDSEAEFSIKLNGVKSLVADDFIL